MIILEDNINYWTERTKGYSRVNEEELMTEQRTRWLQALEEYFPKDRENLKILDVGTGPGFFAIILAERGYQVTAVDCTRSMLEQAQSNAGIYKDKIKWLLSDAQALALKSESFDLVVSRNLTWNLDKPEQAYKEWLRVLKKGGRLINFDANWYLQLYDEKKREEYEEDRRQVQAKRLEDHYIGTDIDRMEEIARSLPLTRCLRPQWDISVLKGQNVANIETDTKVWERIWSETEKVNYRSTPMFSIVAEK